MRFGSGKPPNTVLPVVAISRMTGKNAGLRISMRRLMRARTAPHYLNQPTIGPVLAQALRFYHERSAYVLLAYCIMPNHVHLVVYLPDEAPLLARTLQGIKSFTARHINATNQSSGRVWQPESYDHRIRDNREMQNVLAYVYVVNNPVKARLVAEWQHWPYTFLQEP